MNCNPDGSRLTRGQLIDLAFEAGFPRSKFDTTLKTHVFSEASRELRFEMFWRGELELDTRPVERVRKSCEVDHEMVAFLLGTVTVTA